MVQLAILRVLDEPKHCSMGCNLKLFYKVLQAEICTVSFYKQQLQSYQYLWHVYIFSWCWKKYTTIFQYS